MFVSPSAVKISSILFFNGSGDSHTSFAGETFISLQKTEALLSNFDLIIYSTMLPK